MAREAGRSHRWKDKFWARLIRRYRKLHGVLSWLATNSEPHSSLTYEPSHAIEAAMACIVEAGAPHNAGSNG